MIVSNCFLFFCLPAQALPRPAALLSRSFHLCDFTPGGLSGGLTALRGVRRIAVLAGQPASLSSLC